MNRTTVIGMSIAAGLLASGILVILLVAILGVPAIAALAALALADLIIITAGYIAIRKSVEE